MSIRRSAPLDGLRGIAIITVILNHIPLVGFPRNQFMDVLQANGKVGVCILFLLTGFLMSWLYPNPSAISFWSRRYARLFPSFLVMVVSLSLINNNHFHPIFQLLLVLGIAVLARFIWELCLKIKPRFLTISFIGLQILTALWYSFYLLRIPSPVFYQTWSKNLQIFITALVNGTLTLPFGNYIGQIDGVYWSLVTEVSFYLLYPILFVPIFTQINHQKSFLWKSLLAISTIPFCWSLYFISQRTPGFSLMVPHLYIYFIAGVTIGSNLSWFQSKLKNIQNPWLLFVLFFIIFSGPLLYPYISPFLQPWVSLILVFPLGLLVIVLSTPNSSWGKLLDQKWLVTLGKYSYSLYLTHALCVDILQKYLGGFSLLLVTFALSFLLSWCLFQIIEKPYYLLPKLTVLPPKPSRLSPNMIYIFSLVSLVVVYLVYRPPTSLFTYVFPAQPTPSFILTPRQPVILPFVAARNNLGMVTSHLLNLNSGDSTLSLSLLDSQYKPISQNSFRPSEIIENRFHPLGFPLISDSLNKNYAIKYELISSDPNSQVKLITDESTLNSVYFVDKKSLFKNPSELFSWTIAKISEPFYNPMFWFCLFSILPLLSFLLWFTNPFLAKLHLTHFLYTKVVNLSRVRIRS